MCIPLYVQTYGVSPVIWDHTCHPTQVNAPHFKRRPVLDLPTPEGWKAELTLVLVIYRDGFPVRGQSTIQVLTT